MVRVGNPLAQLPLRKTLPVHELPQTPHPGLQEAIDGPSRGLPVDTPFEDGTFRLLLQFDESYPTKPPTVKFLSRMFHPNVYANGELCLDILQNRWSPTYDVAAILTSIQSLLHDPNPNSPANAEAAQLYRENMKEYVRRVRATVEESWLDPDEHEKMEADDGTS
ncbi:hypothetical protein EIP86_003279 [Pleurotus ostreatoroseus]|nr:hypothetical protein EIP86_003279 [Pleurotus ostreatoroseus]